MTFSPKHPNIQDFPAFLRAMAETLEQMHAENRGHGAIAHGGLEHWLTDSRDTFDPERFKAQAKPVDQLPADALAHDVGSFAHYCIQLIAGVPAQPGMPFRADFHRGKGWPDGFLQLLEQTALLEAHQMPPIADLRSQLTPQDESAAAPTEMPAPAPPKTAPPPPAAEPRMSIQLRNGTVGRPYHVEAGAIAQALAKQRGDRPEQAFVSHLQLPEGSGLTFDESTGAVSGTPLIAFDRELALDYVPARSARSVPVTVKLLINPDPASLWKDLEPPADSPYQKPLLDQLDERFGPFQVVAASRRGRSHANKGEFRDDDLAVGYAAESGWLVVAVADGAGSAKYSRRGSQIACEVARARLTAVLNSTQHNQADALYGQHRDWEHPAVKGALRQTLYDAALLAHHKLREETKQPSETLSAAPTLRNYDTTLILLMMKKSGQGYVAATFAIGDGGAGVMTHAGAGLPLTRADGGEHAGQTVFLTMEATVKADEENLEKRFHLAVLPEMAGALVMTDGITDPKFPSDAAFLDSAQWAAIWTELQPALGSSAALLDWMNFFSPGNHDDRTLVAILPV